MLFVFALGLSTGLIVAWNIWPQPQWMKKAYLKALDYVHAKRSA